MGTKVVIVKCEACLGKRVLSGMGGIERPCPSCNGVGFQEVPVPTNKDGTIRKKAGGKEGVKRKTRILPSFILIDKETGDIKATREELGQSLDEALKQTEEAGGLEHRFIKDSYQDVIERIEKAKEAKEVREEVKENPASLPE